MNVAMLRTLRQRQEASNKLIAQQAVRSGILASTALHR